MDFALAKQPLKPRREPQDPPRTLTRPWIQIAQNRGVLFYGPCLSTVCNIKLLDEVTILRARGMEGRNSGPGLLLSGKIPPTKNPCWGALG